MLFRSSGYGAVQPSGYSERERDNVSVIVVLGGAGLQGAGAARALAANESITQVVVADRCLDQAEAIVESLGGKGVAAEVDASDLSTITQLVRTFAPSVLLNCVGPYRRFGAATLKVAIDAGVNYIDLLDDGEVVPTYFELDDEARAAGVKIGRAHV